MKEARHKRPDMCNSIYMKHRKRQTIEIEFRLVNARGGGGRNEGVIASGYKFPFVVMKKF